MLTQGDLHRECQLEPQVAHVLQERLPLAVSCAAVAKVRGLSVPAAEGDTYPVLLGTRFCAECCTNIITSFNSHGQPRTRGLLLCSNTSTAGHGAVD